MLSNDSVINLYTFNQLGSAIQEIERQIEIHILRALPE